MNTTETQMLRVLCPYCTVGHAMVEVVKRLGADTVDKQPRQCEMCKRYFDLRITMDVSGVPLEAVDTRAAFRKSLQHLVEG